MGTKGDLLPKAIVEIDQKRYEELIRTEQKAEQYKIAILKNTNNNQLTKIMTCIESRSLYELLKEEKKDEHKI